MDQKHTNYMELAYSLAKKGEGKTMPNPAVGCVIVKHDAAGEKVIGCGYHKKAGLAHAEIEALNDAKSKKFNVKNATMYVTLEPCCFTGKTGPCTKAIIDAGIANVVVGANDPNPLVSGKGIQTLRDAGIITELIQDQALAEKILQLNEVFAANITKQKPFVALKSAMSLDGKIATAAGQSKWVSNEKSRKYVHELRAKYTAVLTTASTVIADNPFLSVRHVQGRNPIKVVIDSELKLDLQSRCLNVFSDGNFIVVANNATITDKTKQNLIKQKQEIIKQKNGSLISVAEKNGKLDLKDMLKQLYQRNIYSILVESGGELAYSLLSDRLVDKIIFFIAPKIIGGRGAKTPVEGIGFDDIDQIRVNHLNVRQFDDDIMVVGYLN